MARHLSNTAVPRYYKEFRDQVIRGEIPVNYEVSLEMNRIDRLIDNPEIYYDPIPVEAWIRFCEDELTLVDGSDVHVLPMFKVWAEQVLGWYYFIEKTVPQANPNGRGVQYVKKIVKKRLVNTQYIIVARGAAKTMYDSFFQAYYLVADERSTQQVTTAPTMRQADEVLAPLRTAIIRSKGPLFKLLTMGSIHNTKGGPAEKAKLASTKVGIVNNSTGSVLEIRPMKVDKLQGLRCKIATIDEWLSGETREDPIDALVQSASKEQGAALNHDWLIIATSSEGTVRNGVGDSIKMGLMSILKGEYENNHVSIWYHKLDDVKEVSQPEMWYKANPNLEKTVTMETYQLDVEKAEKAPASRNDILAKRFGIPTEGYTYFFRYEETEPHEKAEFYDMPCALGGDMSQGDDFCAFTFLFPLPNGCFGIKTRSYITTLTYQRLSRAMREKYSEFIRENSLVVMEGTVLDMDQVYSDLDNFIIKSKYHVLAFGYDPYNAREFVDRWGRENGEYGIVKVIQGAKTETVPLGEIKKLAEERMLIFDQQLMKFAMGNAITIEDTNGNRKLLKKRREEKIDNVSALMDAYVAYKANKEEFE
jgi:phage terminase large subunit-like protein